MATLGPLSSWHNVPILSSPLEPEIVALPWECRYCGIAHPGDRLKCWDGVNGCGAAKPEIEEPPRGVLHLREPELEQFGSFYVVKETDHPMPEMHFYPESSMTVTHPGQTAKEHKQEIGARLVSAFQKAIKGAMSLC